ncbi:MAG: T9SS type A sorting domain-containing protein [Bacteroidales bacterium]|nr:T9SS type A sorting domain-containing protein [Bacteroidales bacterium]
MKNFTICILSILFIFTHTFLNAQADFRVPPGTNVTIGAGAYLDIGGNKLLIQDDYVQSPSFLQLGNVSFSGNGSAYVEQYLTKDTWHMVSSPVNFEVNEVYLWNYMAEFDEPTGTWDDINLPLDIPLNAGQGYFAYNYTVDPNGQWPSSPDSAVFDGTLNHQDINIILSNTDASPYSGWNLMGNPYPVALEWNGHADWTLNNVQSTIYIFNSSTGNYETWNYTSGGTNPNGGFIAATQAFWVRTADTTGTPASLTIPESQRNHSNATFLKSSGPTLADQLLISIENNGKADKTIVGFMEGASGEYDTQLDGIYRKANVKVVSLYSEIANVQYALNELPSVEEYPLVQLHFLPAHSGEYTLTASWIESFNPEQDIYLEDKKTGIFYNLRQQPVNSFYGDIKDNSARFVLHFEEPAFYGTLAEQVKIHSWKQTVYVFVPTDVYGEIKIFDISGRLILNTDLEPGNTEIPLQVNTGNYLVNFLASQGTLTQKIFIQ